MRLGRIPWMRSLGLRGPRLIELSPISILTTSTWRPTFPNLPKFKAGLKRLPTCLTRRYLSSDCKEGKTATNQIPVDFVFSDDERDLLKSALVEVSENPYSAYSHFEERIE